MLLSNCGVLYARKLDVSSDVLIFELSPVFKLLCLIIDVLSQFPLPRVVLLPLLNCWVLFILKYVVHVVLFYLFEFQNRGKFCSDLYEQGFCNCVAN